MAKYSFIFLIGLLLYDTVAAQVQPIKLNTEYSKFHINENDTAAFSISLKKDNYYSIVVEQKGIDLVVVLKNKNGKQLQEQDSPNGMFGPEKIEFLPDTTNTYTIVVKSLADTSNSKEGDFSIAIKDAPKSLERFSKKALTEDLDILKNGFIELHVGLWYNTYAQFDSMYNAQKNKIKDKMTALEFYRVVAPFVAYSKEGHSNTKLSDETGFYLKQNGTLFPFFIKVLNEKVYVINDIENYTAKGMLLTKINGKNIDSIMKLFLSIEPSDGYNVTSKYRWVETAFSRYYLRFFGQPTIFSIEMLNPKTNEKVIYDNIPTVSFKQYNTLRQKVAATIPNYEFKDAFAFSIDSVSSIATITINTFSTNNFTEGRKGFKQLLENTFKSIADKKIKHLIIDIRKNEGGAQGMEDHLLSYLMDKSYAKYKYVEIPAFPYSFYAYTPYKDKAQQKIFEDDLNEYFHKTNDGRYLDKKGMYKGDIPSVNNFKGDIYILISGLTFSGGSEFAALAKNYTNAKFIGEETGGGYYGNTSGEFLEFTLPNSKVRGRIPLFKFVVEPKENNIPFGHGVMPDHFLQQNIEEYLNGKDVEMEYAKKLIGKE